MDRYQIDSYLFDELLNLQRRYEVNIPPCLT